jgi:polyketide cyclase/dehydrase/lipid transport protein
MRTLKSVSVDVVSEIEICRPRNEVAGFASDPDNAAVWYENIKSVEWKSPRGLSVGARVAFTAQFLGRRLVYTYEVKELIVGERLVMGTTDGPFPMQTTYGWEDTASGGTTMTLRNQGDPVGFSRLVSPLLAPAMRRANRRDLERLKAILEARPTVGGPS